MLWLGGAVSTGGLLDSSTRISKLWVAQRVGARLLATLIVTWLEPGP